MIACRIPPPEPSESNLFSISRTACHRLQRPESLKQAEDLEDRRRPSPKQQPRKRRPNKASRSRNAAGCDYYRDELLQAVSTPVDSGRTTARYWLLMAVAVLVLLVTPTAYMLLTLGGTLAWIAHLVLHANLLQAGFFGIVFYVVPAITAPFVVLFLLWPLFMKPPPAQWPRKIKRDAEPFLYEYVETLCESLGAPAPHEIRLNCDVNASAGFSGGLQGLLSGRLTLTIGLPLIYGLSLPQLTGVLVHEFGHFSQRGGMRFSFLIRSINHWLSQSAYGVDPATMWLAERRANAGLFGLLFWMGVSCGAGIARVLMIWLTIGTDLLSFALLRQMEFDADRLEARYVGSKQFVDSQKRIPRLMVASRFALDELNLFYAEGRLVDDYPRLVAANIDQIDRKIDEAVEKMQKERETRLFDSHPSDRERIENAMQVTGRPAFAVPDKLRRVRASILFRRIEPVSRGATFEFYRQSLGPRLKKEDLRPISEMLERRAEELEASHALRRYFRVQLPAMFPIPIAEDAHAAGGDLKELQKQLRRDRREMAKELKRYRVLVKHFEHAEDCQIDAAAAVSMRSLGITLRKDEFPSLSDLSSDPERTQKRAGKAIGTLAEKMLTFEAAAGSRLSAAMRLLANERFRDSMPDGDDYDDMEPLVEAAVATADLMAHLRPIRLICHRVVVVFSHFEGNEENEEFIHTLIGLVTALRKSLEHLYWETGGHDYPFDHSEHYATIQTYVLPGLPDKEDVGGMLTVAQNAFSRLATLQMRVFAYLTQAAEAVEEHLGLEPIPDPDERPTRKK